MANSSDWIEQVSGLVAGEPSPDAQAWFDAIPATDAYREGAPFMREIVKSETPVEQPRSREGEEDVAARAFAEGKERGREEALKEIAAHNDLVRPIRAQFQSLDQQATESLALALTETVVALCSQVIEARTIDRQALVASAKEAACRLGSAPDRITIHLHPDDIDAIGDSALAEWKIASDSSLQPGGFSVAGPDGELRNGPEEWCRAIAEAIRT